MVLHSRACSQGTLRERHKLGRECSRTEVEDVEIRVIHQVEFITHSLLWRRAAEAKESVSQCQNTCPSVTVPWAPPGPHRAAQSRVQRHTPSPLSHGREWQSCPLPTSKHNDSSCKPAPSLFLCCTSHPQEHGPGSGQFHTAPSPGAPRESLWAPGSAPW